MVSLQEISRKNGSTVHFAYLPEELIADLGWVKGVELDINTTGTAIIIRRVL